MSNDKEKNIVGVSDTGDIFGIRPLINQENYKLTATANEESIVYGIPIEVFETVTNNNVKVYKYLITAFASNTYDSYTEKVSQEIFVDYLPGKSQDIASFQTSNYTKTPITCEENTRLFLALVKLVTKSLNSVGFEYCEADMMARNKSWCKSISEWQKQFQYWIFNPNKESILLSCIFFDYAHIYGEKKLMDTLTDTIYSALKYSSMFFKFLGKDALKNPPPFGFFKQFLVEKNGDKKDLFNIKNKALMPLIDAARVLTLSKEVKDVNNTAERFEKLAQLEPNNKELFNSCSYKPY